MTPASSLASRHVSRVRGAVFAAVVLLIAAAASARSFDVQALTETNVFCRWPSLSDSGLAVWVQYEGVDGASDFTRSDLYACRPGGQPANLTRSHSDFSGRVEFPLAQGDGAYFLTWYSSSATEGPDFTMAAPPLTESMQALENEYPSLFFNADHNHAAAVSAAEGQDGSAAMPSETPPGADKSRDTSKISGASLGHWDGTEFDRLTPTGVAAYSPAAGAGGAACLAARHWPYGYELLAWTPARGLFQVTTNYFYAQAPAIHDNSLVFQCWDGNDYEIFLHDLETGETVQLTNNTFDDVAPGVWDGQVVWVAYPVTTSEIFLWKDGVIKKISSGTTENAAPCIWDGRVVWQGVADDSKDLDIYYFNGERSIKLTSNTWDDLSPVIRDNLVSWISYVDLADAEVMALDLRDNIPVQLTNDGEEDHSIAIGGERILWQTDLGQSSYLRMAIPGPLEMPEE